MKKRVIAATIVLLSMTLLTGSAFSAHRVEILRSATVNGVELKPGDYKIEMADENTAQIFKGKKLVVTAKVDVVPLGAATPGSVSQGTDGKVREIRLKNERVVFIDSAASGTKSGR